MRVIKKNHQSAEFESIESLRTALLKEVSLVEEINLGAGSKFAFKKRTIRNIAKSSLSTPKKGALLHRIAKYLKCNTILELGTSLGISTAYMASANEQADVYTVEGNGTLVDYAQKNTQQLGIRNIKFLEGNFDVILPKLLNDLNKSIDMVFLDGNHKLLSTLNYFDLLLPHLHEDSILVVDDIYWSEEMTRAWKTISNHSSATLSVDLFECGLVFFSQRYSKQQFYLKF